MTGTEELYIDEEQELGPQLPQETAGKARRMAMWTRERVFAHPFAAIGMAVAAGFVVGRLVRRR